MTQDQANAIADAADRLESATERYDMMKNQMDAPPTDEALHNAKLSGIRGGKASLQHLQFAGGSVIIPQPTRADLLISAEEWSKTAQKAITSFAELAESGDRKGCQAAIRAFMASAQMVADRMLEAAP